MGSDGGGGGGGGAQSQEEDFNYFDPEHMNKLAEEEASSDNDFSYYDPEHMNTQVGGVGEGIGLWGGVKSALKNAIKSGPSLVGMIGGGLTGLNRDVKAQYVSNVRANAPHLTEEQANTIVDRSLAEISSRAMEQTQGMSDSARNDYMETNIDGIVDSAFQNTTSGTSVTQKYDTVAAQNAIKTVQEIDTDIKYQHTLADLSGISIDPQEKKLLDAQKDIAIDRAINEIEDTFAAEGESMVSKLIHNLGTNALGGTIGQGFVKRWQEREAKVKTDALQGIESTYLGAEQQATTAQKDYQVGIWDKQYAADIASAQLGITLRGQNIAAEQGATAYKAWEDANKWGAIGGVVGGIGGSLIKSDWFGDTVKGWF